MNDWPEQPEGARPMRHVQRRPQSPQYQQGYEQGQAYNPNFTQAQVQGYDSGYSSGQVYGGAPQGGGPGGPSGPGGYGARPSGPAPDWRKRIKIGAIVLAVGTLVWGVGTYAWASSQMRNEVDLSKVIERPAEGDCTTYLIVGSDSREGMTAEEKKKLHTGSAEGKRTDSMMILAACSSGN
ncbi:LCP family protein, partial [Streptomyces termitum]